MNKIPSVFLRDVDNMRILTRELNPLCQWVIDGEGVVTRQYDGTCVMLDEFGGWWARREVKAGQEAPPEFKLLGVDEVTGKTMGYEPIENSGFYKIWQEALYPEEVELQIVRAPGTYELCGPKINGNPEGYRHHVLINHNLAEKFIRVPPEKLNDYDVIKATILGMNVAYDWEGFVWHHPDGRMAKMKARDYKVESPQ